MAASRRPRRVIRIERIDPILNVRSLQESLRFYRDTLGFDLGWQAPGIAAVSLDDRAIMLVEGAQGQPGTWTRLQAV